MRQIKPPTPPERKGENQQTKTGISFAQPNDRVKKKQSPAGPEIANAIYCLVQVLSWLQTV
jgi:hypothetical protein